MAILIHENKPFVNYIQHKIGLNARGLRNNLNREAPGSYPVYRIHVTALARYSNWKESLIRLNILKCLVHKSRQNHSLSLFHIYRALIFLSKIKYSEFLFIKAKISTRHCSQHQTKISYQILWLQPDSQHSILNIDWEGPFNVRIHNSMFFFFATRRT